MLRIITKKQETTYLELQTIAGEWIAVLERYWRAILNAVPSATIAVGLLQRATVLPDVLPELRQYLVDYPSAALPGADSYFYWEKVDFGLKPTIRLNHAVIYRGRAQGRDFATVAIKQLYATHYFHTALDVAVCVIDRTAGRPGFYLLTVKGSHQEGLTGVRGSLLRKVVVGKTRDSLERALAAIKRTVEHPV